MSMSMSMGVCSVTSVVSDSLRPHDCSLPGSFVHGILHARILDQVAISYCRASSQPRNQTHVSCVSCISRWIFYHCTTWEAISISIYLYLCLYLCIYLKVELLDHMVILCLAFLRNCHTVFHSSRTILHSHQQGTGFQLLHVLDNTCYILFFQHSHPAGCEVVCHGGFCHEFKGLLCVRYIFRCLTLQRQ